MIAQNYIFGRKYGANFLRDLVAYYPLNGNSIEVINGLNGTDTGISYLTGNVGLGANFTNSTTSRIAISDTNFLSFTDGVNDIPFTMIFSVKQTATGANFIFSKTSTTGTIREYGVLIFNNKIRVSIFTNSTNFLNVDGNTTLTLNTWYNIVVTYDGSKLFSGIKIYINDVMSTITNLSSGTYTGMTNTGLNTLIGSRINNFSNEVMKGIIDETYIYKNRVLTVTEVSEVYTKFLAQQPLI